MREFSWLAVLLGVVISAVLAAANAFVGLKVGLVISASIPAAVLALLILRTGLKSGTLLECNIVQTIGSAGESVASGMIFTVPALFIMQQDATFLEMVIWGSIGGLLGVCFMVPLRQVLIVREHGRLPFPEGVACAEVLRSGASGGAGAKAVVTGSMVGAAYFFVTGLGFWRETAVVALRRFRTEFQVDSSPALLGVGYILGARIAAYMLAGAVLSWFVLIPAIGHFGAASLSPVFPEPTRLIGDMSPDDVYRAYVKYIGAGAVAVGGLISLFTGMPTIVSSFWHVTKGVLRRGAETVDRTQRDIPSPILLLVIAAVAYALWRFPQVRVDHIGVAAVVLAAFFFVTVSSRLVGLVGASSNPISGMTIATLLGTTLVYRFFVLGDGASATPEQLSEVKFTCLSIGAIVCMAVSVAGDTSQDLKTGFLVKATPYKQQMGEMIGVLASLPVIAGVILLLDRTYGFGDATPDHPHPLLAPQAHIMKILVESVLGGQVPWTLIMVGGASAVIVEMLGLPALPFAVGMYLPLGLSTPIMVGGVVRWMVHRRKRVETEYESGVLASSGLVAGMGLMGVAFAGVLALIAWLGGDPRWVNPVSGIAEPVSYVHVVPWLWHATGIPLRWGLSEGWWDAFPLVPFALLTVWLWRRAVRRPPIVPPRAAPAGPLPGPVLGRTSSRMPTPMVDVKTGELASVDPESRAPKFRAGSVPSEESEREGMNSDERTGRADSSG